MTMTTRSAVRALIPVALSATLMAGCNLDEILKVQPANLIPAVDLERPVNAPLLVAGAVADFDCAFNSFVVVGGLIGEERVDFGHGRRDADDVEVNAANEFLVGARF